MAFPMPTVLLAQDLTEQAPVTAWPERLGLTAAVLLATVVAVWAMWRNWRKRIARQDWVQTYPLPGREFVPRLELSGRYVACVPTEDWLERIAANGLGMPGRADILVGADGVLIRRDGALDVFLPAGQIVEATSAKGIAQEVYERDGIVAITWRSGLRSITTGLRLPRAAEHVALLDAVSELIGKAEV